MFEKNEEVAENLERLLSFIDQTTDGSTLSWVEIEQQAQVRMDMDGRQLFRRAMHKRKREYFPVHGSGVLFSDPKNTIDIARLRDARIGGAAKRAKKAGDRLQTRHLEELSTQDRAEFLMRQSLRGALLNGSKSLKQLASEKAAPPAPQLPEMFRNRTGT